MFILHQGANLKKSFEFNLVLLQSGKIFIESEAAFAYFNCYYRIGQLFVIERWGRGGGGGGRAGGALIKREGITK